MRRRSTVFTCLPFVPNLRDPIDVLPRCPAYAQLLHLTHADHILTLPALRPQEGELTSNDLDASISDLTLGRQTAGGSTSSNLFPYIHQQQCDCSNAETSAASSSLPAVVLRPHDTRQSTDLDQSIISADEDSGILFFVAFSELVRIKQIMITSATGDERIERCRVWANRIDRPSLDEVEGDDYAKPDQAFELLAGERQCVEYPVRVARFSSVSSLIVHLVGPASFIRPSF